MVNISSATSPALDFSSKIENQTDDRAQSPSIIDASSIAEMQKIQEGANDHPQPAPTRAWGIPITEEQARRLTALAAISQGSAGLLKGGAALAALGVTGGLLAIPVGILVFNHFANKSSVPSETSAETKTESVISSTSPEENLISSPSSFNFEGHKVDLIDSASEEAEAHTKQAWNIVGLGAAVQIESQFLYGLTAAHATVAASPMALIIAGAWVLGFTKGIVSFNRTNFTASNQPSDSGTKNNLTVIENE